MKTVIATGVLTLLSGGPSTAIAEQGRWYSSDHMLGSGGWMWGSMFMWVILLALVVLGFFAFSKSRPTSDTDQTTVSTPLDLLNVRYAKGEINQQEYESKKILAIVGTLSAVIEYLLADPPSEGGYLLGK